MNNSELVHLIRQIDEIAAAMRTAKQSTINFNGTQHCLINPDWLENSSEILYKCSNRFVKLLSDSEVTLENDKPKDED